MSVCIDMNSSQIYPENYIIQLNPMKSSLSSNQCSHTFSKYTNIVNFIDTMIYKDSRVDNQPVLIPELNVSVNGGQLKELKRRMLAKSYDDQINQKQTIIRNRRNFPDSMANPENYTFPDVNNLHLMYERSMKSELAEQYKAQMARKQQHDKKQKERVVREEQQRLKNFEICQDQGNRNNWARQENRNTRLAQQKQHGRRDEGHWNQRQLFRERRSQDNLNSGKHKFFHQYYRNLNEVRDEIERNYIQNWQPKILEKQKAKVQLMQYHPQQDKNLYRDSIEQHTQIQRKFRNQWRKSLQNQMLEKQEKKLNERKMRSESKYTQPRFSHVHHPINNPIDFKFTHDNRYIIKQMMDEPQNRTRLAHSGSQTIKI